MGKLAGNRIREGVLKKRPRENKERDYEDPDRRHHRRPADDPDRLRLRHHGAGGDPQGGGRLPQEEGREVGRTEVPGAPAPHRVGGGAQNPDVASHLRGD